MQNVIPLRGRVMTVHAVRQKNLVGRAKETAMKIISVLEICCVAQTIVELNFQTVMQIVAKKVILGSFQPFLGLSLTNLIDTYIFQIVLNGEFLF